MDRPLSAETSDPAQEEEDTGCWLYRLVQLPDGTYEDQDTPLQPEEFLDPRVTDRIVQGLFHYQARSLLTMLVQSRIRGESRSCLFSDQKLLWGIPGLPEPTPDLFLVRGAGGPRKFWTASTYDVVTEGILPCLIVEVAISWVEKLWRADHVDKLEIYQRVGVPEYLIVDLPGPLTNDCFVVTGYRLDSTGARYEPIEPDSQGRVLCKAVDVLFGVASDGSHLKFFEGSTGEPLMADRRWRNLAHRPTKPGEDPPNLLEETTSADSQPQETLDEIQARAAREVEARKNAEARLAEEEAKIARLRREAAGLRLLYVLKVCLLTRLGEQVLTEEKVQEAAQAC